MSDAKGNEISCNLTVMSKSKSIEEMTKWVFEEYIDFVRLNEEENTKTSGTVLPVQFIDGVKVQYAQIRYARTVILLDIPLKNCEIDKEENMFSRGLVSFPWGIGSKCRFSKWEIKKAVLTLQETLKKLHWDKEKEKLSTQPLRREHAFKTFVDCAPTVRLRTPKPTGECPVCYEQTSYRFDECQHYCCRKCVSNLKQEIDDDSDCECGHCGDGYVSCTLCRAKYPIEDVQFF